ncbi:hypothetical protein C7S18_02175 [Ahniella affigens]|uniref:TIR domain-containing protein n=1 Tax=Ahniella affigens TaxID=2021234 RepID=A0A2P1PMJ9_9GAMM|nr:toll/interleukin-1 receptor domain-containing protein [Ahniella affigens]AVP96070.1 hypothetical protein C7S18_02175 [Ahniella affigens]
MNVDNLPRIAFISHTTPYDSYVAELESFLLASGFDQVFNDVSAIKPDELLWPTIEQGILSCTTFYFVIGDKTKDSVWVQREVAFARSLNKPIVPVQIDDCELPSAFIGRDVIDLRTRSRKFHDQKIADSKLVTRHTADKLFGRDTELAVLDEAWNNQEGINIQCVIAWGGVGKTALLAHWVQTRFRNRGWKNSAGQPEPIFYFDWTFYDQGTRASDATHAGAASIGTFFTEALRHFGDPEPENPERKAERLAKLVQAHRNLIVLDGLEPLQYPYGHAQAGQITDPDLAQFLRLLAQKNPGLCVISSRERLSELGGHLASSAPQLDLDDLPTEAAIALLRNLGVIGSDTDLIEAAEDYHHHALSLILLGRFLATARGGDIRQRDTVSFEKLDSRRDNQTRSAWHILETYEKWLGSAEGNPTDLQALRLVGLFDRPATPDCLEALRQPPAIPSITDRLVSLDNDDWNALLWRLNESNLIQLRFPARDPANLAQKPEPRNLPVDAHPLVREYFARQLSEDEPQSYQTAHAQLFKYLCQVAQYQPDTLESLQTLYQAVLHGCLASRHQEAREVYRDRILRGTGAGGFYTTRTLGAFGAELGAVTAFFDSPWKSPSPKLARSDQAWLINLAAFRLTALGRVAEALEPTQVGLKIRIEQKAWRNAAIAASNLSELEVKLGMLEQAVSDAFVAVQYADRDPDPELSRRINSRTIAADGLHQWQPSINKRMTGKLCRDTKAAGSYPSKPEKLFEQAESILRNSKSDLKMLVSLWGFRYCDLILASPERAAWKEFLFGHASRLSELSTDGTPELSPTAAETSESELPFQRGLLPIPQASPMASTRLSERATSLALAEAICRANYGLQWALDRNILLEIALDQLTLARGALYGSMLDRRATDASTFLQVLNTLKAARKANFLDYLPKTLVTAAAAHHLVSAFTTAGSLLDEAQQIAERGPMPLHLADVHLHRARLVGSMSAADRQEHWPGIDPKAELAKARALIEKLHYGRRFDELADAEAASEYW